MTYKEAKATLISKRSYIQSHIFDDDKQRKETGENKAIVSK